VGSVCAVVPITEETHDAALALAEKHALSIYDAMILASALLSGCPTVLSEDMHDGQVLEGRPKIRNPFR
jgi:predicted nucleic acid-binding protein